MGTLSKLYQKKKKKKKEHLNKKKNMCRLLFAHTWSKEQKEKKQHGRAVIGRNIIVIKERTEFLGALCASTRKKIIKIQIGMKHKD